MTLTRRQVSDLLASHGLHPSRALGQNFVADPNTVRRVARLAEVGASDRVLEIGPGLGSLTLALAETGASITAVEADRHMIPILEAVVGRSRLRIVNADAMKADWQEVLGSEPGWVLVANLPYNIATPLIADLLDSVPVVSRMLVMVQSEVAERLVAGVGDSSYGAVSVKIAYWAEASIVGQVPASVFIPRPKVESALVSIRRRDSPAVDASVPAEKLFGLVKAGFSKRRKMLRRSLAGQVDAAAFEAAGISSEKRAEDLSVEDWGRLAGAASGPVTEDPEPAKSEDAPEDVTADDETATDTPSEATPSGDGLAGA